MDRVQFHWCRRAVVLCIWLIPTLSLAARGKDRPSRQGAPNRPVIKTASCLVRQSGPHDSLRWQVSAEFVLKTAGDGKVLGKTVQTATSAGNDAALSLSSLGGLIVFIQTETVWQARPGEQRYLNISKGQLPTGKAFNGMELSASFTLETTTTTRISLLIGGQFCALAHFSQTDSRLFAIRLVHVLGEDWCRGAIIYGELAAPKWLHIAPEKKFAVKRGRRDDVRYEMRFEKR